ncbi:MAG: hypothetical protein ACFBSC_00115 [Microcoleaceae cyanobacterium]
MPVQEFIVSITRQGEFSVVQVESISFRNFTQFFALMTQYYELDIRKTLLIEKILNDYYLINFSLEAGRAVDPHYRYLGPAVK